MMFIPLTAQQYVFMMCWLSPYAYITHWHGCTCPDSKAGRQK